MANHNHLNFDCDTFTKSFVFRRLTSKNENEKSRLHNTFLKDNHQRFIKKTIFEKAQEINSFGSNHKKKTYVLTVIQTHYIS